MTFRAGCQQCAALWSIYTKLNDIKQLLGEFEIMSAPEYWANRKTECSHCGKDIRGVSPTYTVKDSKEVYCSRACRSTVTGEDPEAAVPAKAPKKEKADATGPLHTGKEAPAPAAKKAAAPPPPAKKAAAAPAGDKPARAPRTSLNLEGKVYKKGTPKFQEGSARMQFWNLIKDGMTLGALMEAATKAGLDGKATLAKINIVAPGAIEVK